ncbi:VOC family protein [Streptomyces sp. NPDC058231]|uniref:VOC family protein n=1 Tax=Streptomyces sp. NPDC058231 TaxID=3346392 RepID=UPI0036EA5D96
MLTTEFVTGAPNWLDLSTPDLEAAAAFYQALLGWEFEPGGTETGGYGMFTLNGKSVAGAMAVPPERAKSSWTVYFRTSDVDATAKAVAQAGGTVPFPPMDVLDFGRMGGFTDRGGAYFGTWQPRKNPGLGAVGGPRTLCWAELYTPDVPAAAAFYGMVFGWETHGAALPGGGGSYTLIRTRGGGEESEFGGLLPLGTAPVQAVPGPHWLPYFEVDDCDATVADVERLGGKLTRAPVEKAGVGTFADVADPFGAHFAVIRSANRSES